MSRQYSLGNGPPPGSRFGGATTLSPSPASSRLPSNSMFNSPSLQSALNPSTGSSEDFPALSPSAAPQGSSSLSNSLFNSYASSANSPLPPGMSASSLLGGGQSREFSQDDFPALGGYPSQQSQNQSSATGSGAGGDVTGLSSGVNGISLTGRTGAAAATAGQGQEQASALAALAAQQQHRASLLGAMNGTAGSQQRQSGGSSTASQSASDKNSQQPWAASPSPAPSSFPSSLLSNGAPASGSVASSPLPPPAASTTGDQLRSPSIGNAGGGNNTSAVAAAILAQAAQQQQQPRTGVLPTNSSTPSSSSIASQQVPTQQQQIPQTPAQQVLFSPADRFGLIGLLHIIKTANTDQGMLALGNDLTNLGLDLGAPDNLYSNFITPWSDSKTAQVLNIEPEYTLPSCYNVQPPPANTKIGNFSDETLFFIFYSQPRDAMQEMAAHELYKHNWRYHKELKLWLTKEAGTEPVQKTATFERGSYIFFDPVLWERVRRDFILQFDQLETRRA
ncbi:CCR4-NOT core subunit CDC36 [Sporobolomyces salmoneus]|uniref:CCR4-NOT core subunit CDC36 n=1 Tax=Sporobolomyces salmoneus TaxID=183962 RepID=UPI0031826A49